MLKIKNLSKHYGDAQIIQELELLMRETLEALYVQYVPQPTKRAA